MERLAEESGMHLPSLQEGLTGLRGIGRPLLKKVASALKVPVEELLTLGFPPNKVLGRRRATTAVGMLIQQARWARWGAQTDLGVRGLELEAIPHRSETLARRHADLVKIGDA